MDHLLGLVGDRSSEFLVREVFLRSLPDKISIVVAASTSGFRDLGISPRLVCSSPLPSRLSTKFMSGHRKYTHHSYLNARHATVNLHKLACVTITISHAFRETPVQATACEHSRWPSFETRLRSRLPVGRELFS